MLYSVKFLCFLLPPLKSDPLFFFEFVKIASNILTVGDVNEPKHSGVLFDMLFLRLNCCFIIPFQDAIRSFSNILLYIQRTKNMFQTKSYQYEQVRGAATWLVSSHRM